VVRTTQNRKTVTRQAALTVNGIARNDAGAVSETNARDGQTILTTIVDPVVDGLSVEVNAFIVGTTVTATPRRLLFTGTTAVEIKPVKTVTARTTGAKSDMHHVPVGLFDENGSPTIGTARALYGDCAVDHCIGLGGLVLPFTVPDGETLAVTIESPGAAPITVALQGRDKPSPPPRPAKVQLAALPTTWDATTGASSTISTPRAYDSNGDGVECHLFFATKRPVRMIVREDGKRTITHNNVRAFDFHVKAKPTTSCEFVNVHEEHIEVNCDVLGLDGAIDNMVLPAAEPRPGEWRADMTKTEKRRYYRLGGK
jgi:hypothetical protein